MIPQGWPFRISPREATPGREHSLCEVALMSRGQFLGRGLPVAISMQHPPLLGGNRDSAPTHPLWEVTYKIEVKLPAKLEKGSDSAALGKQGGKNKWRAFWKARCHFPGPFPSYLKLIFTGV